MIDQLHALNALDLNADTETDNLVRLALLNHLGIVFAGRRALACQSLERELAGLESGLFAFPGGQRLSFLAAIAVGEAAASSVTFTKADAPVATSATTPSAAPSKLLAALLPLALARDVTLGSLTSSFLAGLIVLDAGLREGAAAAASAAWLEGATPVETAALALTCAQTTSVLGGLLRATARARDVQADARDAVTKAVQWQMPKNLRLDAQQAPEEVAARFMQRAVPDVKAEQALVFATNLLSCERAAPWRMLWDALVSVD